MTTIHGYSYESAAYCVPCTQRRFPNSQQEEERDINGIPMDQEDAEGNPIHPIFEGQESDFAQACYSCREEIEGITVLIGDNPALNPMSGEPNTGDSRVTVLEDLAEFKTYLEEFDRTRPAHYPGGGIHFTLQLSGGPSQSEIVEVGRHSANSLASLAYREGYRLVAYLAIQHDVELHTVQFTAL